MNNNDIVFNSNLSVGVLNIISMELTRIDGVNEKHEIFRRIVAPFDWYFHEEIMLIPDSKPMPKQNWEKVLYLCEQEIRCIGQFVYFFHFEILDNNINFVTSLTLPEYDHIKKGISFK
ncbi:hypothetical protein VL4N_13860 [Vagococcus lutrae]|uniref:hypothetical protein n=1 Tax=Vagococcus lutrae TaxID=81947 RepID=UPI0019287A3B|nr:hypothetical protein [Vagococcus lutrae]GEQ62008.1 hypothetical protein VL2N_13440 [Vagococcus lutrae]GEQ63945.1 hypothetical protein VL3N_13870 [Vagococcus lutrae]GEQ65836.1 hypothetical protein VL4N_13860 [Vagococcus lutrae]